VVGLAPISFTSRASRQGVRFPIKFDRRCFLYDRKINERGAGTCEFSYGEPGKTTRKTTESQPCLAKHAILVFFLTRH
jgi:hypothetical protein